MSKTEGRVTAAPAFSIPGKVFLLGEYLVLRGGPAWVAALAPRFCAGASVKGGALGSREGSPAHRFLVSAVAGSCDGLFFYDPYASRGGFGASTAEFALALAASGFDQGWREALGLYRRHAEGSPSGADLVTQWNGGVGCYDPRASTYQNHAQALHASGVLQNLLVFSASAIAGRKTATHSHLQALDRESIPESALWEIWDMASGALLRGDLARFGQACDAYADVLSRAGLENALAQGDRHALRKLPGVAGVKGCGAMLSDAVLVVLGGEAAASLAARTGVIQAATSRGLELVADGLRDEPGLAGAVRP